MSYGTNRMDDAVKIDEYYGKEVKLSTEAAPTSVIDDQLNMNDELLSTIYRQLNNLEERLAPVSSQDMLKSGDTESDRYTGNSRIAAAISVQGAKLRDISNIISRITGALEI